MYRFGRSYWPSEGSWTSYLGVWEDTRSIYARGLWAREGSVPADRMLIEALAVSMAATTHWDIKIPQRSSRRSSQSLEFNAGAKRRCSRDQGVIHSLAN